MRLVSITATTFAIGLAFGCGKMASSDDSTLAGLDSSPTLCPAIGHRIFQPSQTSALEKRVLQYAAARQGKKVGSGQCSDLADAALKAAGAKSFAQLGPTGDNANYVWGSLAETFDTSSRDARAIYPGDVIQYDDFSQRVTNPDGSWWTSDAAHHTSVVDWVAANGLSLCVFEQNVNGRMTVGQGYVSLAGLTTGTLKVYRPIK